MQQTGVSGVDAGNWTHLFFHLAQKVQKGRVIILMDEISWMADKDPTFLGKLKNVWDLHLKKNPKIILILCGSSSAWIDRNILSSTGFVGRISLEITLKELPLAACKQFWGKKAELISSHEILTVLAIMGGVPRYLEEIIPSQPAEKLIQRLCFTSGGFLVEEFNKIFSDLFDKRASMYKKIVHILADRQLTQDQIRDKLNLQKSGIINEYLTDLIKSGFITRDHTWSIARARTSSLSRYRLSDNYIRFYLKYIEPNYDHIKNGHYAFKSVYALQKWPIIMGFQFENLVLNNRKLVYQTLNIDPHTILYDNPYFQKQTKTKRGCQIDYLIQDRFNTLYVCEIKFSQSKIPTSVITDIEEKIKRLNAPKKMSVRPILIYVGEITEEVKHSPFFDKVINFGDYLK